jgi:pilus assembly protein Flp/PilA
MYNLVLSYITDRSGATGIEYGLIAALIGIVILITLTLVGGNMGANFLSINTALSGG